MPQRGRSKRSASAARSRCAHPNRAAFASKRDAVPGFQVEIARELAKQLEVSLEQQWVINGFQYRRAGCDIVLRAIADRAALAKWGCACRGRITTAGSHLQSEQKSSVASLADLQSGQRVGSRSARSRR